MDILTNTVVVRLDMSTWTGKAKLSRDDLPPDANIPPEDLAILGQKRLIDPDTLRPFGMLKSRAIRLLDRYGVKFLSGWLVRSHLVDQLDSELREIQDEFYAAKDEFMQAYHNNVMQWMDDHPQWRIMLEVVMPSEMSMEKKFSMRWQVYKVEPVDTKGSNMGEEIANIVNGDVKKMTDEIQAIYDTVFAGRTSPITQRTLRPLKEFALKCNNLVGIYPSATYVAEALGDLLAHVEVPLDPQSVQYMEFRKALLTMSDASIMSKCVADWMDSHSDNMYGDMVAAQGPEPDELARMTERRVPEDVVPVTVGEEKLIVQQDTNQRTLSAMMDDLF